jgi:chromosome segregation ATPase
LGILTAQITKQDEQRDKLNNTVKRLEEDFKRRQSPEVIKLKDRIKDMNQERKDLEAKVNKFKAKTDSTADRLKKVEHDSQDALKKADEMQKSIEISGIETE